MTKTIPKLKKVIRLDAIDSSRIEWTDEGYLFDTPVMTRVGIFEYTNPDGSIRRELRLPEHVFEEESLASYEGKPIIVTHDAGRVDTDNVSKEHIGTILSKGYRSICPKVKRKVYAAILHLRNHALKPATLVSPAVPLL